MSDHTTSENSDAGLFPFLAVLLCTMGALLVLLIVMAQRAGKRFVLDSEAPAVCAAQPLADADQHKQFAATLAVQLAEVREYRQQLKELHRQAQQQLGKEQQRLSHLEEHTRRLEYELSQLSIAAQQLDATEENQSVDQDQAAGELERLRRLIEETQARLDDMRLQPAAKKSYAIVPYQGPHGTYRKPIYIECSQKGIILHPEGIRLKERDFLAPSWPGNPLAAALRASREYLKAKAAREGHDAEPPDPYPLILVRPDGLLQYAQARAAIRSWDADFGYEFINSDWQLEFPELPDPQLARAQKHALLIARQRLERLVQSAPSQFQGFGADGAARGRAGGVGPNGWRGGGDGRGSSEGLLGAAGAVGVAADGAASLPGDTSLAGSEGPIGQQANTDGVTLGSSATDDGAGGITGASGSEPALGVAEPSELGSSGSQLGGSADRYASGGEASTPGSAVGSKGASGENDQQASAPGSSATGSSSRGTSSVGAGQMASIAEPQGSTGPAPTGPQRSVPIRRTIHIVVRRDHVALLPSRHETHGVGATGIEISLNQSRGQIAEKINIALRNRMKDWGLAGSGLVWRPVLQLNVGPDAGRSAIEVERLLRGSGVEVRILETAQQETDHELR